MLARWLLSDMLSGLSNPNPIRLQFPHALPSSSENVAASQNFPFKPLQLHDSHIGDKAVSHGIPFVAARPNSNFWGTAQ